MKLDSKKIEILEPKAQLKLYGYDNYFNTFLSLYKSGKLPKVILLDGQKGSGKATFVYHFINYILSSDQDYSYSLKDFEINLKNSSLKLMENNVHPNFFLLDSSKPEENIKIEQVRNLLRFLNKSVYPKNIKLVLIDNSEYLNINSANALLSTLENANENTFFFIINNNTTKMLDTLLSRSIVYKIHFTINNKKKIFKEINYDYNLNINDSDLEKFLYFESPGNLLKFTSLFQEIESNITTSLLETILFLLDKFKYKKDLEYLYYISLYSENYFNQLAIEDSQNFYQYYLKKNKVIYLIDNMKKYNLDKKNLIISIERILKNEKK